jgi:hypothetical protein
MENKEILNKIQELGLTQVRLAKTFRCRPQQVFSAIHNGDQVTLRKKIIKHLKVKEQSANKKSVA